MKIGKGLSIKWAWIERSSHKKDEVALHWKNRLIGLPISGDLYRRLYWDENGRDKLIKYLMNLSEEEWESLAILDRITK